MSEAIDPPNVLDVGSAETQVFECGCEATLFDRSAVVAVKPCDRHDDRLTAIK